MIRENHALIHSNGRTEMGRFNTCCHHSVLVTSTSSPQQSSYHVHSRLPPGVESCCVFVCGYYLCGCVIPPALAQGHEAMYALLFVTSCALPHRPAARNIRTISPFVYWNGLFCIKQLKPSIVLHKFRGTSR